jgi:hypothetical protein
MSVRVHVNRQTIAINAKRGEHTPPLAIRRGGKVEYAHEVQLIGSARVVYRPDAPLPCGAKVWIECDDACALEIS